MESEGINLLINSTVLIAVFVGAFVLLLVYIIKMFNADQKSVEQKAKNEKLPEQLEKKKDPASLSKTKKKSSEARWNSRSDKQSFSHPWLLTSLKGHTSQVLDMEFSSSGKYLASCGEEEPDSGDDPGLDTNSSCGNTSDSNQDISLPSSSNSSPRPKGLSRRQRKNRRREDHSPADKKKQKSKRPKAVITVYPKEFVPIDLYDKLVKSFFTTEESLVMYLRNYTLKHPTLVALGYPVQFQDFPGQTLIIKDSPKLPWFKCRNYNTLKSSFNVNAREFVPGSDYYEHKSDNDSGQGSGNSSDSSEGSDDLPTPLRIKSKSDKYMQCSGNQVCQSRACVRCDKTFFITASNTYLMKEKCTYHWGKFHKVDSLNVKRGELEYQYTCCGGNSLSSGCTTSKCHVWNGVVPGCNGPLRGFKHIRACKPVRLEEYHKAYALDCEMCYTVDGLELTKVTVVSMNGSLVYDSFVKPANDVIDYNTRFSGITAKDLKSGAKTLKEVQKDLMGFLHSETILIGHGLENDLRALKLIHGVCVDTSILFQSQSSILPKRHSLKYLSSCLLQKQIQCSANGHNSYEDAKSAMELVLYKIASELGF